MSRFLMISVAVALLFWVVIAGIQSLTKAMDRYQNESVDAKLVQNVEAAKDQPLENQIAVSEDALRRARDPEARMQISRHLVVLLERQAEASKSDNRYDLAEQALLKALSVGVDTGSVYTDLSELYVTWAKGTPDVGQSRVLWAKAADAYRRAADVTTNSDRKRQLMDNFKKAQSWAGEASIPVPAAGIETGRSGETVSPNVAPGIGGAGYDEPEARRLFEQALQSIGAGRITDARNELYLARRIAPPNSEVAESIDAKLAELTGVGP